MQVLSRFTPKTKLQGDDVVVTNYNAVYSSSLKVKLDWMVARIIIAHVLVASLVEVQNNNSKIIIQEMTDLSVLSNPLQFLFWY